jgi:TatD DNase family protein
MLPAKLELIDIGANLGHESFRHDLDHVLHEARAAGVVQMLLTGSDLASSQHAVQLAERHPRHLFATVGLHPHHASHFNAELEAEFAALQRLSVVRAIGEAGLDYFRDLSPRAAQLFAFERQLELGVRAQKPMFLHMRDAHDDFLAVLKNSIDRLAGAVVHCFTADRAELFAYLDLDCHIGLTGWIADERRGTHLVPLAKQIPLNRLLLETDAPYLMPRNIRPKPKTHRNEPKYLPYVLQAVADARGMSAEALAAATTANARRLFAMPELS